MEYNIHIFFVNYLTVSSRKYHLSDQRNIAEVVHSMDDSL